MKCCEWCIFDDDLLDGDFQIRPAFIGALLNQVVALNLEL